MPVEVEGFSPSSSLGQIHEKPDRVHFLVPKCFPPRPSARDNDIYKKENIQSVPEFRAEQSKRIARVALDYYNRKKKIKFELLEVRPVNFVPTKWRPFMHINFVARSRREGSQAQIFFAELYLCGKRQSPSGYSVILCEPVFFGTSTHGQLNMLKHDPSSPARKNLDFTYCYACGTDMLHPKRTHYIGGHSTVPGIYKGVAML